MELEIGQALIIMEPGASLNLQLRLNASVCLRRGNPGPNSKRSSGQEFGFGCYDEV